MEKGETMGNECRARAIRCRPAIAKSHEASAEHAHVYSILAATKNSRDDDGNSARRRRLGDDVAIDRTPAEISRRASCNKTKYIVSPKYLENLILTSLDNFTYLKMQFTYERELTCGPFY